MKKEIIMIGTSQETKGGISSVVNVYKNAGLFQRWNIFYLDTHVDGSNFRKCKIAFLSIFVLFIKLLKRKVNFVHLHVASRVSFWRKLIYILLCLMFRKKIIFHLHGAEFQKFYKDESGPIKKSVIKFVLDNVDVIVVLSSQWKVTISNITRNPNIICIYNPVVLQEICSDEKKNHQLLFLGRLGQRKGIYDLIKAVTILRSEFDDLTLVCGGDGELEKVKDIIDHANLSDVVNLVGWIVDNDKNRVLLESSIYVLPSYNEGLPMSILEAMAYGLPIVSTNVGGIPDAIENNAEGILIEPGDIIALTDALRNLLANKQVRENMGAKARKKVLEIFSIDKITKELDELYTRLDTR